MRNGASLCISEILACVSGICGKRTSGMLVQIRITSSLAVVVARMFHITAFCSAGRFTMQFTPAGFTMRRKSYEGFCGSVE